MNRGYIRITKNGPTEAEQSEKLLAAGVAPEHLYIDDATKPSYTGPDSLKARDNIVRDIRSGSRIVVTSGDRFGVSMQDVVVVLGLIVDKGAAVHDLSTGETLDGSDYTAAVRWAIKAEAGQKRTNMSKARDKLLGRKVKRGPKPKLVGAAKDRARALYGDLSKSIREVSEETGISPTQLRRIFKDRENPVGSKPKTPPTE